MKFSKNKLVGAVLCVALMLSLGIIIANTRNFDTERVDLSLDGILDESQLPTEQEAPLSPDNISDVPIKYGAASWAMLDGREFDLYLWESIINENRRTIIGMSEEEIEAFMLEHGFIITHVTEGLYSTC